jgi:serine/threonine-protein kinase
MKLSNILISSRGRAMLVDFGLASIAGKMSDEALSQFPNPRTIDYAALERATGVRKDDKRSDIYFAGCIMYNMLSGKAPLRETKERIQRLSLARFEEIVPITTLVPDLPVPVAIVVNKSMDLNPTKRYQTPAEMLEELRLAERRLEEGDVGGELAAASGAEGAAGPGAARSARPAEGHGKAVMVVESSIAMQDLLREQLKKCGYRVLVFSDPARAMSRFQDAAAADCVMFCCNQLGEAALNSFNEFGRLERTKRIPAVLLLTEKQAGWEAKAHCSEHRKVISMPIRIRELRETVAGVMAKAEQAVK